jgi:hypothetical protein
MPCGEQLRLDSKAASEVMETSDSDDLERELRKNLRLRRELGTEAAKLKKAIRKSGRRYLLPLGLGSLLAGLRGYRVHCPHCARPNWTTHFCRPLQSKRLSGPSLVRQETDHHQHEN